MSFLDNMSDTFWRYEDIAPVHISTQEEIDELQQFSKVPIPNEFIEFLREVGEAEIGVKDKKDGYDGRIIIYPAVNCIDATEGLDPSESPLDSYIVVATNASGGLILYGVKDNVIGVYIADEVYFDENETLYMAPSLKEFFENDTGVDAFFRDI